MIVRAVATFVVMWAALVWIRFCLGQLDRYPPQVLSRQVWAFLIVVTVPLGGIAYFLVERGWRPR